MGAASQRAHLETTVLRGKDSAYCAKTAWFTAAPHNQLFWCEMDFSSVFSAWNTNFSASCMSIHVFHIL